LNNNERIPAMPVTHHFHQLDVFSNIPLLGNPLAVVHAAADVSDDTMARFARWTNLSETTFLLPPQHPDADYRVRIFTPGGELPFAGHPTLGSCHAWLIAGGIAKARDYIVQECGIGLVRIRRDGSRLAFAAPPLLRSGDVDAALLQKIARGLGISRDDILQHQWVDNGAGFCAVMLRSAEQVRVLKPDFALLRDIKLGVIAPQAHDVDTQYEVRAFVGRVGIAEDPVTGSLNAGLATWMIGAGLAKNSYVAAQGTALQRRGRVFVDKIDNEIWIGGDVAVCIEGSVTL
jgi:PhzF family phenazine biosynthesis protein